MAEELSGAELSARVAAAIQAGQGWTIVQTHDEPETLAEAFRNNLALPAKVREAAQQVAEALFLVCEAAMNDVHSEPLDGISAEELREMAESHVQTWNWPAFMDGIDDATSDVIEGLMREVGKDELLLAAEQLEEGEGDDQG